MRSIFSIFMLLCIIFTPIASARQQLFGPIVQASADVIENHNAFVTEIYEWDNTFQEYVISEIKPAGYYGKVEASVGSIGHGKISLFAYGDVYQYSGLNPPLGEQPRRLNSLTAGGISGEEVGAWILGVPAPFLGDGVKVITARATGAIWVYTSTMMEIKGRARVNDHAGGASATFGAFGVSGGAGSGTVHNTGDWVYSNYSWLVSALKIYGPKPTESGSQDNEDDNGLGLNPVEGYIELADGSYSSNSGTRHSAMINTGDNFNYIEWYLKTPGDMSDKGSLVETDWGYGTENTASLSYTFPSEGGGNYTITAKVYPWDTNALPYEENYDIAVY